jgi:hypothetical protein
MLLSVAFLLAGIAVAVPASAKTFNDVQVFASPASSQASAFQFAAYNLTGSLIVSYSTPYPAAAFELPTGGYLFTVSSIDFNPLLRYACPMVGAGVSEGSGSASPGVVSNGSSTAMPIECYPQSSEYGYTVTNVSGPQTINIKMQNVSTLPTTQVSVRVSYVNGTAAADASVYASVIGEYYWWWQDSSIRMGAQTDSNGIARLVVPEAPAVVTAWKWIPVFADKNGSTTQTPIGGQKVNITIYWQTTYIGLSGSGVLIPPQNSINLTLRYQQPTYWVMPAGVDARGTSSGPASAATVANQPSGTPSLASASTAAQGSSEYYLPQQIPAIQSVGAVEPSTSGQAGSLNTGTIATAAALFAIIALAVVLVATRRHSNRPSASAA